MFTPEDQYYIRYFFLLLRGGTLLLQAIFEYALQQKGEDLHQFLKSIKPKIQKKLSGKQKDILYPSTGDVMIEDLDITLLAHLITGHLKYHLDRDVLCCVEQLKELRNQKAHSPTTKMDTMTFTSEWYSLIQIIQKGFTVISEEVKEKLINFIDNMNLRNQEELVSFLEEIKIIVKKENFIKSIQRKFEDIRTGHDKMLEAMDYMKTTTSAELKEMKAEMKAEFKAELKKHTEQVSQEVKQEVNKIVQIITGYAQINPSDEETQTSVIPLLKEACKRARSKSTPKDNVQKAFAALCQDVENRDVEIKNISSGSIVFEFQCCSLKAIVDLIDYFYSPSFQERLDSIAIALGEVIGKTICITADGIDRQSIECVTTKMKKKQQNVMQFEMSCTGIDGLLHVMEVFEEEKAAHYLNDLSMALSEVVGKTVTLHTSIDMDQMRNAVQSIREQLELQKSFHGREEPKLDVTPISLGETSKEYISPNKSLFSTTMNLATNKIANLSVVEDRSIKPKKDSKTKSQTQQRNKHKSKIHYLENSQGVLFKRPRSLSDLNKQSLFSNKRRSLEISVLSSTS